MTSERQYNLPAQPEQSCPTIDRYIASFKEGMTELAAAADADDLETAKGRMDDAVRSLEDMEDNFEWTRQQCIEIRNWGQSWKDLAKEKIQEAQEAEEKADALESKANDLQSELNDAQSELANAERRLSNVETELADTQSALSEAQAELEELRAQLRLAA